VKGKAKPTKRPRDARVDRGSENFGSRETEESDIQEDGSRGRKGYVTVV